nr:uncharacterized protein LOC109160613 [Ipomoea batatas]
MIHFPIHIIQVGEITLTSHGEIKVMQGHWDHLDFSNKDHQDFSNSNTDPFQQPPTPQQPQLPAQEKPQLEEMFMQYMSSQDTMMKKLDAKIDKVAQSSQASIHNLEVQVGQLAKLVAEKDRGKFPSATEVNPRERAMAVTLRSGKMLNEVLKEKEPLTVEKDSDKEGEQLPKESSSDQNLNSSTVKPYKPSKEVFCKHSPSDPLEACPIEKKEPEFVESMMRLEGQGGSVSVPPPADAAEPFPSGKRLPREEEVGTAGSVCRWGDAAVGAVLPCGGVQLVTAGGVARWCPPAIPLGVACLVKDDREIFRGGRVLYVPLSEFRQRSVFFTHSSIPIRSNGKSRSRN